MNYVDNKRGKLLRGLALITRRFAAACRCLWLLMLVIFCTAATAQSADPVLSKREKHQIHQEGLIKKNEGSQASPTRVDGLETVHGPTRRLTHEQREELRREIREAGNDVYKRPRSREKQ